MLNRIEIRNFKAIQDGKDGTLKPLILDNLAQVNYLVGKNGSGKSSVLETMFLIGFQTNGHIQQTIQFNKWPFQQPKATYLLYKALGV